MLKITGLRSSNPQDYYLEVIARGAEEYYVRRPEHAGVWIGGGSSQLGLDGVVAPDDLRAILDQRHPVTGEKLSARQIRRVGFDLTLSAPKSVSLLWALGDADQSAVALGAHRAAVEATVEYLEANACQVRRGGRDGYGLRVEKAHGLIGAAFAYFTSRAADPQVHTHLVIANMAEGADGRFTALHGTALFEHRRAAGYLYQAVLRHELHRRLGVGFDPVVKGSAEIAGIPKGARRVFSKRRAAIEAELAAVGGSGERASQTASLKTRQPKDHSLVLDDLLRRWRDEAARAGIDIRRLPAARSKRRLPTGEELAEALVLDRATFSFPDLVATTAALSPDGATLDDINRTFTSFLESPLAIPLPDTGRWTTAEILELERRSIDTARHRRDTRVAVVHGHTLTAALAARPSLSAEQRRMVRHVCASGNGVDLVVGAPGSGKTFALGAARLAWQAEGHHVIGCALAARAAAGLHADSGIPSHTIAKLLGDVRDGRLRITDRTVIVCDEAAMVGTRDLARLIDVTDRANAKLVLVGDPKQLPPIEAGGLYPALERRAGATRLVENRRQRDDDERQVTLDLRRGRTQRAVVRLERAGRLTLGADPDVLLDQMVADWAAAKSDRTDAVMIALTHDAVAELNQRARTHLDADGRLGETVAQIGDTDTEYAIGDTVVCLRNDRRLGVRNGDLATVVGATGDGLVVERAGQRIELPVSYLAAGHLDHGYALTVHKAQGATYDVALLYGDEHLYAEAGYTALTRGRDRNHVYVLADTDGSAADAVRARLARVSAEPAALDLAGAPVTSPLPPGR
ncbi:MAG: MobF family relaxase [Acidimicrobiia bacterium]